MVGRIIVMQRFILKVVGVVKIETQEVLVLTESVWNRDDGVLSEGFFFFLTTTSQISRVLSFLILNRCERKL